MRNITKISAIIILGIVIVGSISLNTMEIAPGDNEIVSEELIHTSMIKVNIQGQF